jgi:hypothetical protein
MQQCHPRNVPTRTREACHQPSPYRIAGKGEDDGDRLRGVHCSPRCRRAVGHDDIDLQLHQFRGQRGKLIVPTMRPSRFDDKVSTLLPSPFSQPSAKRVEPADGLSSRGVGTEKSHPSQRRLCPGDCRRRREESEGESEKERLHRPRLALSL